MNDALLKFLNQHADKGTVWFLVPGGVIYGKLNVLEFQTPDVVTLREAFIFRANKAGAVKTATVSVIQISAWGETLRAYPDQDFFES